MVNFDGFCRVIVEFEKWEDAKNFQMSVFSDSRSIFIGCLAITAIDR